MNLRKSLLIILMIGSVAGALVIAFFAGAVLLGDVFAGNDCDVKPTVYGYYTSGGIKEGLKADNAKYFTLNKKEITLHSGSIHYFRVHPQYWRDRLRKLRAAGFIAVETYVPWNLHEPYEGVYDFGDGGEDMSPFLDIRTFLRIAREEDLLAILRPGPYICAEWEFGGMPSWLLRYKGMKVRTSDSVYMEKVRAYFSHLLPILKNLQFSTGSGPIIAFQVENEYGNTKVTNVSSDKEYLRELKLIYEEHGLVELYATSDTPSKGREDGALPGVLETANFNENATTELELLKQFQPDKPSMVMEYWTGWYDHWGEAHNGMNLSTFKSVLEDILNFPSSVNFYMFHGGTSFGFMNGGNVFSYYPHFLPDITSYDYDAPLTECGDYTDKYYATRELFAQYQKVSFQHPSLPAETEKENYNPLHIESYLDWSSLIDQVGENISSTTPMYMEDLDINYGSGQSYGYIVYRKTNQTLTSSSTLNITGYVRGAAFVVVNNELRSPPLKTIDDLKGFAYWCSDEDNKTIDISVSETSYNNTVDVIVENWSRNNYGKLNDFDQNRGLTSGQIYIDGEEMTNITIYPLQFKGKWVRSLSGWQDPETTIEKGPVMLKFKLTVDDPKDTFLDMSDWTKGIVFVNGFNLGRYAVIGPQRSLFVPAPLLNSGVNYITVFEHFAPATQVKFSTSIIFKDAAQTFNTSSS